MRGLFEELSVLAGFGVKAQELGGASGVEVIEVVFINTDD